MKWKREKEFFIYYKMRISFEYHLFKSIKKIYISTEIDDLDYLIWLCFSSPVFYRWGGETVGGNLDDSLKLWSDGRFERDFGAVWNDFFISESF